MRLTAVVFLFLLVSCGSLPKDPEGTLERVSSGVLRAGAVHAPPWVIVSGSEVGGTEAALVEGLAGAMGARVEWTPGGPTQLLEMAERFELDLVAGGFIDRDPWSAHLGVTQPHYEARSEGAVERRVFFLPPGENRWLLTVDRYLREQRSIASAQGGNDPAYD
jgi:hypothetical protein